VKRALRALAVVVAGWVVLLFVLGFVFAGRAADKVTTRMTETLQAPATIGARSLGLVFGSFSFERLTVARADLTGKLVLEVGEVDCDLPPLGLALVDRSCSELAVRDVKLELSTIALIQVKRPTHTPFRADHVVVDNADLVFSPSAFLPSLGRIRIKIDHAEAGPTTFKSPLSWLFTLTALRARFELPAGIELGVALADGKLVATGTVFGSTPVSIPLVLPKIDSADDARSEIRKLVEFGKDLAEQLVAQKAEDWIRNKLP
jgi:hypothetical protein